MPRIIRSSRARNDLIEIGLYIARENARAAFEFLDDLDEKIQMLANHPRIGQAREELGSNLRSFSHRSYVIFFRPIDDGIQLVRVLHGARDVDAIF